MKSLLTSGRGAGLVVVCAWAVALGRLAIEPRLTHIPSAEGSYEAFAHLFVGFLLLVRFYDPKELLGPSKQYFRIGLVLGLWELGWFIAQKLLW